MHLPINNQQQQHSLNTLNTFNLASDVSRFGFFSYHFLFEGITQMVDIIVYKASRDEIQWWRQVSSDSGANPLTEELFPINIQKVCSEAMNT